MQHKHTAGRGCGQVRFEKLSGNDGANQQEGKAAGIMNLLLQES